MFFKTRVLKHTLFSWGGKSKFKEDKGLAQSHSAGKWGLTTIIVKVYVFLRRKQNQNKIYNTGTYGKQSEVEKTCLVLEREGESEGKGEKMTVTVCDGREVEERINQHIPAHFSILILGRLVPI